MARRRFGRDGFDSRIIWILGSPRSGSTWLLRLLADRPEVVPIDEPLIGHHLGPLLVDGPGISMESLDSESFTLTKLRRGSEEYFFSEKFASVWAPPLGDLIRQRFLAHAIEHPPAVELRKAFVAVKEPNGSQAADVLLEALPSSRVIFLVRDGRDVVDSEMASMRAGSWVGEAFPAFAGVGESALPKFVRRSAYLWLWRTQVVQDAFARHRGPKLMLRYEDLRSEPARELRAIFDWLDLRIDATELDATVERFSFERLPRDQRGPSKSTRTAQPGLWRENFGPEEVSILEDVLGPKLRELGYPG